MDLKFAVKDNVFRRQASKKVTMSQATDCWWGGGQNEREPSELNNKGRDANERNWGQVIKARRARYRWETKREVLRRWPERLKCSTRWWERKQHMEGANPGTEGRQEIRPVSELAFDEGAQRGLRVAGEKGPFR